MTTKEAEDWAMFEKGIDRFKFTQVKLKLVEGGQLPRKMTDGAAAYDCYARTAEVNYSELQLKIKLGFCLELPQGYCAKIIPRSSIVNTNLRLSNCIGLIDCDYRGEVSAIFDLYGVEPDAYKKGDRVCQMLIERLPDIELVEVDTLSETKRGTGGYGHTGK